MAVSFAGGAMFHAACGGGADTGLTLEEVALEELAIAALEAFWAALLAGALFTGATGVTLAGAGLMDAVLWALALGGSGFAGTGAGACVAVIQAGAACGTGGGSSLAGANGCGSRTASKRSGLKLEYRIGGTWVHSPAGGTLRIGARGAA